MPRSSRPLRVSADIRVSSALAPFAASAFSVGLAAPACRAKVESTAASNASFFIEVPSVR